MHETWDTSSVPGSGSSPPGSLVSQSCPTLEPHRPQPMGCHFLFQKIFVTQGSNPHLLSPELAGGFFTTEPPTRKWNPLPVFLPGKFHGQRGLAGCWGHKELDITELLSIHTHTHTHTELFYNVVLVSALQQSGSAIRVYIYMYIYILYMIYYFFFRKNIFCSLNLFWSKNYFEQNYYICVAVKSFIFKMLRLISEFLLSS